MNFKIPLITSIAAVVIIFKVNAYRPSILNIQQKAEDSLQGEIIKAKLPPKLGSSASSCHSFYSDLLQSLLKTYEKDLNQCKDIENKQLVALLNEGQQSRAAITESLNGICENIQGCKAESKNLDFFDCIDRLGDKSTRGAWKASRDLSDNAAPIIEMIHDIKYQARRCSSEAERAYIVETANATDDMMACYTESEGKDQVEELEKKIQNPNEF